ncbi:hypothetical protein G9A89_005185 [Geosiphon pyriformis]|nr:hypothetical protein G9A89_005185 [Geosiphon pyriformis]
MNLKTAFSSNMSKKKVLKGTLYDLAGGSFSQKKKVVLDNVKHSGDERDISLVKLGSGDMYSDMNSESSCGKNNTVIKGINSGSLLGLAATIPKAKRVNSSMVFGIIRSMFISEKSMEMAVSLVREKKIDINSNLKRQGMRSNWAVVIKEISINTPKNMIIVTVSEFGKIKSIKIQLIGMWQKAVMEFAELDQADLLVSKWSFLIGKDSVYIAKAVEDHKTWASKDQFRVLLFTLPVRTIAHNLRILLNRAGEKTCIINRSLKTGNRIHCAVVSFEFDNDLESAFHMELIFGANNFSLNDCLNTLECSLELLTDQVSSILKKLSGMKLVPTVIPSSVLFSATPAFLVLCLNVDMALDDITLASTSTPSFSAVNDVVHNSSSSFFKVLTSKVGELESKMVAFEVLIGSVLKKLDHLCSGADFSALFLFQ